MKKISANIFFLKKIFPVIWFGFLAFFVFMSVTGGLANKNVFILVAPIVMGIFGYVLMKKILWDLVDQVYDCGTHLLVKNRNEEDKVNLSDVMNVSVVTYMNPPRITLRLRRPSKFGDEISFSPARNGFGFNIFAKNAIAEDLMIRVDRANSRNSV